MRNVTDKSSRVNQNTYFVFNNVCFFFKNHVVYKIMRKNNIEPDRP